jgi:hypothetical protein
MDKMKKVKKKKKGEKFDPPPLGFEPRILNKTFLTKIWIMREIRSIELMVLKKKSTLLEIPSTFKLHHIQISWWVVYKS